LNQFVYESVRKITGLLIKRIGCSAKRKRAISRRVQKALDMERFHHFGTVFVKECLKTGKVVKKPCVFDLVVSGLFFIRNG